MIRTIEIKRYDRGGVRPVHKNDASILLVPMGLSSNGFPMSGGDVLKAWNLSGSKISFVEASDGENIGTVYYQAFKVIPME